MSFPVIFRRRPELDVAAPVLSSPALDNDGSDNLAFSLDADEQLAALAVTVDGPATVDAYSFSLADFTETDNGDGTYSYALSTVQAYDDGDGEYTATVDTAEDDAGNDGSGATASMVFGESGEDISTTPYDDLRVTITDSAEDQPPGTTGGQVRDVSETSGDGHHYVYRPATGTGAAMVVSLFVKQAGAPSFAIHEQFNGGGVESRFDFGTGAWSEVHADHTVTAVDAGDGWWWLRVEFGTTATTENVFPVLFGDHVGNTDHGVLVWGVQIHD